MKNSENKNKKVPNLVDKKEHCCGCTACYAKCPKNAIQMLPDEEGFLYPHIDEEKCIRCYNCVKVCIFKINQKEKGYY